jgi:membrane-bound serine protease (ClpP class)
MLGLVGVAKTPLAPFGKIFVHGELWNAMCREHAQPGDEVVVKAIHGLELEVENVTAKKQTV